jgi:hypothetical protein
MMLNPTDVKRIEALKCLRCLFVVVWCFGVMMSKARKKSSKIIENHYSWYIPGTFLEILTPCLLVACCCLLLLYHTARRLDDFADHQFQRRFGDCHHA